jgi:hypothetical protein
MLERRGATRIDKVFRVLITTEEHGDQSFIARNISGSGMFVEMPEPLPLKTKVIVRFSPPGEDAAICAMGRIQNHYYLQYAQDGEIQGLCGVGLRFLRFLPEVGGVISPELLH